MNEKLHPFHIAILIHLSQVGVTLFSLPRLCAAHFGTNGWIGLLAVGLAVTANIALMQAAIRMGGGRTLPEMLAAFLPKPLAGILQLAMAGMYALIACLIAKQYVLMFELLSFPATNPFVFRAGIDVLVYVLVIIGIYNLGKAATLVFFSTAFIPFVHLSSLNEIRLVRYTPFFLKGDTDFWTGSLEVYAAFLGFELCLFLLPYVDRESSWFRAVYAGHVVSLFVFLGTTLLAFGFFSYGQLLDLLYPLLDLSGHVRLPIIERVDSLMFTFFFLVAVLTVVVYFWIATELAMNVFPKADRRWVAGFFIIVTYFVSSLPHELAVLTGWLRVFGRAALATAIFLPLFIMGGLWTVRLRRPKT